VIYVGLPIGSNFGWGILGKSIVLEMAELTEDIKLVVQPGQFQQVGDEIDQLRISRMLLSEEEQSRINKSTIRLNGSIIQGAFGTGFVPHIQHILHPYDVGFAVFEEDRLPEIAVNRAKRWYRHLATGSTYCAEVLKQHGFENVSTVLHGVDSRTFHPSDAAREIFPGKFVVFSGGKFELRKGQDIVIRAYKVLQDRHPNVAFVNSWFNLWPPTRDTMVLSKLIDYSPPQTNSHPEWIRSMLTANGIDMRRVLTIGMRDNRLLPRVYHNTDVGLFPNRAEGGTNMVMMEYMACGKPVVGAFNTGHKDVLSEQSAVLIRNHQPMSVKDKDGAVTAHWCDPDLEETIEKLEWAYQNREKLKEMGRQAAVDMSGFTWKRVAEGLLKAIKPG
jgi:glycosyltransferase involved in cell wall biosynthesis